jgi:hypothetical protein
MTNDDHDLMNALSRVDPGQVDPPPAKGSVRYESILEAAMKRENTATRDHRLEHRSGSRSGRSRIRRWYGQRWAVAGTAAAVVVLAGVITGVMLLTGGPTRSTSLTPALAAEAVKKAAADTAAAGQSGVVETVLYGPVWQNDGAVAASGAEPQIVEEVLISQTFSWNGEDLAITTGGRNGPYELRYVDGRFYEKGYFLPEGQEWSQDSGSDNSDGYDSGKGQAWFHRPDLDNGGGYDPGPNAANEAFIPAKWLSEYRSALVGSGLMDLVSNVSGLAAVASSGGSTTYNGTIAAAELSTNSLGLSGVPFASQPLDKVSLFDSSSPVAVEVSVGEDGLVRQATLSYELEGSAFRYRVTYSQLGTAPSIDAPDPSLTTAAESPLGSGGN